MASPDRITTAHEFFCAVDDGPHDSGDASRLRQTCIFCGALSWAEWWTEEDHPGGWVCEDEDACYARVLAS
jgi:hypothetical protein